MKEGVEEENKTVRENGYIFVYIRKKHDCYKGPRSGVSQSFMCFRCSSMADYVSLLP